MNHRIILLSTGVLGFSFYLACTSVDSTAWENYTDAGRERDEQAHYAEAEELFFAALKEAESFGEKDTRLATTLNDLALLYTDQGKYAEAEPFFQRSLAIWEKALGPEHPDVAIILNNLGLLYTDQGKYAEAEPLFQRSIAIREKALGPEHSDVATSLENYAFLLQEMDRNTEADKLKERASAIRAIEMAR
jgi:tetratricopeptide (TPR) repeat protein